MRVRDETIFEPPYLRYLDNSGLVVLLMLIMFCRFVHKQCYLRFIKAVMKTIRVYAFIVTLHDGSGSELAARKNEWT